MYLNLNFSLFHGAMLRGTSLATSFLRRRWRPSTEAPPPSWSAQTLGISYTETSSFCPSFFHAPPWHCIVTLQQSQRLAACCQDSVQAAIATQPCKALWEKLHQLTTQQWLRLDEKAKATPRRHQKTSSLSLPLRPPSVLWRSGIKCHPAVDLHSE